MKRSHSDEELSDIAAELGIDVAFVEKDIFATEVLAIVFDTGCEIVFGGGTSLSKAYDLIQRFSDDLDLRICLPHHDLAKNQVRKQMTEIRHRRGRSSPRKSRIPFRNSREQIQRTSLACWCRRKNGTTSNP